MSFTVLLDSHALEDIQDSINYYNNQKANLGAEFEKVLDSHIKILSKNPHFQKRYGNVRCLPLKKFPFMIHFEIYESTKEIIIRAVLNTSIDSKKWKR